MKIRVKNLVIGLLSVMLISSLIIGCDNATPSGDINGVDVVNTRSIAKPVDKKTTKYKLETSFKDEDFYYYMYYLGRIENVPLQSNDEVTVQQHTGVPYSYTFTTTSTTTSSIETQISKANENCSTWQDELSGSFEITAGINNAIGASVKGGYQHTWGEESKTIMEESIIETKEYSEEYSKEITVSFDEKLEKGFYRYILMGSVDVFAIIVYDVADNVYYCDNVNSIVSKYYVLDYSPNSEFLSATNQNLPFDCPDLSTLEEPELDCTPEITTQIPVFSYNSASKTLIVNLSSYQETGIVSLENEWFKDNILTINPKYQSQDINKIKIVGYYTKEDQNGAPILTSISNFSIRLHGEFKHELTIVLQNVAISTENNVPTLDFTGIGEYKVKLALKGTNKIESNSSQPALCANNLEIQTLQDSAKIEIFGKNGVNGGSGGSAINCENLTVLSGNIDVKGGDGGNGISGENGGDGEDGTVGLAGGNGGVAIIADNLFFVGGNLQIQGGNGGNGGNGGGGNSAFLISADGGNGGNGGNGGAALSVSNISIESTVICIIQGGTGGNGGNGGYAGGNKMWCGTSGNGGNGGNGGNVFEQKVENAPEQSEYFIIGEGGNAGSRGVCWGSNTNYGKNGSDGNDGEYNP